MDLVQLRALIDTEPANAARTDQQVLDWLYELVPMGRRSLSGQEIFDGTDPTEYLALSANDKVQWLLFTLRFEISPNSIARNLVEGLFGNPSTTYQNLLDASVAQVNRTTAWTPSLPDANLGDVQGARAL